MNANELLHLAINRLESRIDEDLIAVANKGQKSLYVPNKLFKHLVLRYEAKGYKIRKHIMFPGYTIKF